MVGPRKINETGTWSHDGLEFGSGEFPGRGGVFSGSNIEIYLSNSKIQAYFGEHVLPLKHLLEVRVMYDSTVDVTGKPYDHIYMSQLSPKLSIHGWVWKPPPLCVQIKVFKLKLKNIWSQVAIFQVTNQ